MKLPTGLTFRPEFSPQHDSGPAAPPAGTTPRAEAPNPNGAGTKVQEASKKQSQPGPMDACGGPQIAMLAVMMLVFYFLLIRPQQKQEKQLKEMRAGIKKGDEVVMTGGMHAIVVAVDEQIVTVKPTNDGPVMRFDASAVGRVLGGETAVEAKAAGGK